jgi:hypothetical protein
MHPADELAQVLETINELQDKVRALESHLISNPADRCGEHYIAATLYNRVLLTKRVAAAPDARAEGIAAPVPAPKPVEQNVLSWFLPRGGNIVTE